MKDLKYVGKRTPDIYGFAKLSGEASFSDDLWLPGMLYGKLLRSPHPHARIIRIDTSKALELEGVVAVMTGEDTPRIKFGAQISDMYPLAIEKVRYVGDPVAVVAAETEEAAWDALELIEVGYEILPAVLSPEDALKKGAPEIHDGKSNLLVTIKRDFGDTEKGFEESDYVFEDEFSTQALAHCNLEPRCSVARMTPEGVLELWTGTQSPLFVRKEVANVCDLPLSKVRVMNILSGGGFGARSKFCEDEGVTALLAIHTGRPVKITFTREEEITTTRIRQPFKMKIKTGANKDGTIPAREMHVVADKGAYCHYGIAVVGYAAGTAASMYRTPNFKYTGDVVYTNKQFGGPFRGFGAPQATFAIEVQMDKIAEKLGIDPMELRLKNGLKSGYTTACGWQITSCGFEECVRKAAESTGWKNKRVSPKEGRYRRGIGMASAVHVSGSNVFPDGEFSSIEIKMFLDGQISIYKGSGDTGMWSNTVISQIVAEELDLPMSRTRIVSNDTEVVPQSLGSFASRVCFADGNAARKAAVQLRNYLLESASAKLGVPARDLAIGDGSIYSKKDPKNSVTYGDAVFSSSRCVGHVLSSKYQYDPPTKRLTLDGYANVSAAYAFSVQVAEVAVDIVTGEVIVEKMTVVQDVGRAINPIAVEGQIEGAVVQGIGFALSEELITNSEGVIVSDCLEKYMMPTSMDIPDIEVILVETEDPEGPFGAKGVGEIGMNNTAAAIANAIYNAVGVRMHKLPMKAEDVYFALKKEKKSG
jgi:CO/xanthine dehydrogenase Mo-binding subunit